MRPYFAEVIRISSPGRHWALNVSQLQYSLRRSKSKQILLYYVFLAADYGLGTRVVIHLPDTSSEPHASILC